MTSITLGLHIVFLMHEPHKISYLLYNARELLKKTQQQEQKIKKAGYSLVVVWEYKAPGYKDITHEQKTVIYPHAIVYDFEAYLDKAKIYSATKDLTFENVHVSISDPKVLIEKFMNELQSRASQLRAAVKKLSGR